MSIKDWASTATENASVAGINFAEGQAPSTLNDSSRLLMAQVRQEYQSERWGWVAQSGTASVNSQTVVKITEDITTDAVANRKVKLTGGSTTVYADIVSSSYGAETAVTIANATGSLCASHTVLWVSAIYDKNLPGNVVTGSGTTTLSSAVILGTATVGGSASFSASVHITGPVEMKDALSVSGKAAFLTSASFSASVKFEGPVAFNAGGVVASATLSVAAGMLTVGGVPVGGSGSGPSIIAYGQLDASATIAFASGAVSSTYVSKGKYRVSLSATLTDAQYTVQITTFGLPFGDASHPSLLSLNAAYFTYEIVTAKVLSQSSQSSIEYSVTDCSSHFLVVKAL